MGPPLGSVLSLPPLCWRFASGRHTQQGGVFELRLRGRCDLERLGWPSVPGAPHLLRPLYRQSCLCL